MKSSEKNLPARILLIFVAIALLSVALIVWWIIFFVGIAKTSPDYDRHLTMLVSEGSFFVALVICGLILIYMTLRQQIDLRYQLKSFFAGFSHELRSPIAALKLHTETMQIRELAPEQSQGLLRMMLQDIDRLQLSIENIIDLHRLESKRKIVEAVPIQIGPWIDNEFSQIIKRQAGKDLQFSISIRTDAFVDLDVRQFHYVIANLVQNSVRYAGDTPILEVNVVENGKFVIIEVNDSGIGFSPTESELIFEKFYRIRTENSLKWKGSGLGLFISREIVKLHRGSITAHSRGIGQGASFIISIPKVKENEFKTNTHR